MLRRLKFFLLIFSILTLFYLFNLWFKQYILQKKSYFDDKETFPFHMNTYESNKNDAANRVERRERNLTTLSQNLDTITERPKDVLTFQKGWKLKDQTSALISSKKLVQKSHSPEILFESIERSNSSRFKLIVLVSSHALHPGRREVIRKYWGNYSQWTTPYQWKVIFVTGFFSSDYKNQLYVEGNTHKDILVESIEENFYTLSFKVMLGLKWVEANLKYDFLLKCDDDVFVDVDRLMKILSTTRHQYFGQKLERAVVRREGKYGVSKEEHPHPLYDPYCSGGGFVLSHRTVSKMIPFFNWVNPLKIDDAYIGNIVTRTGIKAVNYRGFSMHNYGCFCEKNLIVSHPVKKEQCMEHLMHQCHISNW